MFYNFFPYQEKITHIVPVNDLKEHQDTGLDCECKPDIETEGHEHFVIHHAYDGRE